MVRSITRCLLLVAPSAAWLLTNPSAAAHTASRHRSVVACDEPFSRIDRTIGEILDEERSDALPALLGRRLDVLTDPSFLARIEERRASAPPGRREELERVGEVVVTFLEALTLQVSALQPELEEEERAAQAMTSRAAEAAAKARITSRLVDSGARPTPRRTTAAPGDMQAAAAPGMEEALAREKRAKYRFLVERLLDAAKAGTNKLDALLREERARLDREFFEHMRWEVEEQTKAKNRRMLDILEVVVQRACIEVEEGRTEVALLSALLQTRNPTARSEMYERELALTSPRVQAAFAQLVRETQLELEKAVMRGQQVDGELLQMLRVISAEATNHIALP